MNTGPAPSTTLIPYSDPTKIVTYLVPSNFNGSSSTTWGNDYPNPMTKTLGYWDVTSDGKSVRLYNRVGLSLSTRVTMGSDLANFTVYMVVRYGGDTVEDIRGLDVYNSSNQRVTVFRSISSAFSKEIGSVFNTWESGNANYFNTNTTPYDAFQAYSISYPNRARPAHILNDMNLKYFPGDGSGRARRFQFDRDSTKYAEIYIKLLAIVSEADSDTVMQNNINYIRNQLNLT